MAEDGDEFLQVADGIGRQVIRSAIWHSDRCNWVGAEPRELVAGGNAQGALTYRALTPDLYSGTSGVALFLAELYRLTGEPDARATRAWGHHTSAFAAGDGSSSGPARPLHRLDWNCVRRSEDGDDPERRSARAAGLQRPPESGGRGCR